MSEPTYEYAEAGTAERLRQSQATIAALRRALEEAIHDLQYAAQQIDVYSALGGNADWIRLKIEQQKYSLADDAGAALLEELRQTRADAATWKTLAEQYTSENLRLRDAGRFALAIADGRESGTWDDVRRMMRAALDPSSPYKPIGPAMDALRELVNGAYDGVDVDAYVREVRDDDYVDATLQSPPPEL